MQFEPLVPGMLRTKLFSTIFLAISNFLISASSVTGNEKDDINIHIDAESSVSSTKFNIEITKHGQLLKVNYKLYDSIKSSQLNKDTTFIRLMQQIRKNWTDNSSAARTRFESLDNITRKYYAYDRDSIILKANDAKKFVSLLTDVSKSSKEDLERTEQNKHIIVLDGTEVTYTIISNNKTVFANVHSPTIETHPLLYKLLTNALNLYRGNKHNSFLNKKRTCGY